MGHPYGNLVWKIIYRDKEKKNKHYRNEQWRNNTPHFVHTSNAHINMYILSPSLTSLRILLTVLSCPFTEVTSGFERTFFSNLMKGQVKANSM